MWKTGPRGEIWGGSLFRRPLSERRVLRPGLAEVAKAAKVAVGLRERRARRSRKEAGRRGLGSRARGGEARGRARTAPPCWLVVGGEQGFWMAVESVSLDLRPDVLAKTPGMGGADEYATVKVEQVSDPGEEGAERAAGEGGETLRKDG